MTLVSLRTAELAAAATVPQRPLSLVVEPANGAACRHLLTPGSAVVIGGDWASPSREDGAVRLRVADPTVSARHARVESNAGRVRIVDLGSKNGTWVGGARVEAATLSVGGCAMVGRSVVSVEEASSFAALGLTAPEDELTTEGGDGDGALLLPGAVGRSAEMRRLATTVSAYAGLSASALIRGESGSGKEVVARAVHMLSPRRSGPFIAVNLGALPRELAESELFGSERGAYTGSIASRPGVFELAHGGTLFLDELGELPLDMQAKLLRVLETGEVRRLGAPQPRQVDVRVLAATWAPLERRIADGAFREDLFHRIAVLVIDVPPLRTRKSDIPALSATMLRTYAELAHKQLTPAAISRLCEETWPGNVRELRNVVYRAAALSVRDDVDAEDISRALSLRHSTAPPPRQSVDHRHVDALVRAHGGNISAAARAAGLPRETLRDWLRQGRRR